MCTRGWIPTPCQDPPCLVSTVRQPGRVCEDTSTPPGHQVQTQPDPSWPTHLILPKVAPSAALSAPFPPWHQV